MFKRRNFGVRWRPGPRTPSSSLRREREARRAHEIAEAVNRAKQIGLGLVQFAPDSNDVLPGQGIDLHAKLARYLKNDSILQGFTYTLVGGGIAEIEDIVGTELGFISGPGGRAVVYSDGHARWVPNAPD